MRLSQRIVRILSVIVLTGATAAFGQSSYPTKPIRIITSGLGGGNDFVARLVAQGIQGSLGQSMIVDNRTTPLSGELVAQAPPDGHTLLLGSSTLWVVTLLQKQPYDAVADFSPITLTTRSPNLLVVHPAVQAASVKELISLAKAKSGALNYGTSGAGSSLHLAGELFKSMAGVNIVHVPYKATGLAINELLGGQVQLMFSSIPGVAPHVKTGKLRALAVTSADPTVLAPGIPTVASGGLPGYETVSVEGFFAPAKTPAPIIMRLNQEIVRFINQADTKEKFLATGSEVIGNAPQEFGAAIKAELARMGKVIKDANIRAE